MKKLVRTSIIYAVAGVVAVCLSVVLYLVNDGLAVVGHGSTGWNNLASFVNSASSPLLALIGIILIVNAIRQNEMSHGENYLVNRQTANANRHASQLAITSHFIAVEEQRIRLLKDNIRTIFDNPLGHDGIIYDTSVTRERRSSRGRRMSLPVLELVLKDYTLADLFKDISCEREISSDHVPWSSQGDRGIGLDGEVSTSTARSRKVIKKSIRLYDEDKPESTGGRLRMISVDKAARIMFSHAIYHRMMSVIDSYCELINIVSTYELINGRDMQSFHVGEEGSDIPWDWRGTSAASYACYAGLESVLPAMSVIPELLERNKSALDESDIDQGSEDISILQRRYGLEELKRFKERWEFSGCPDPGPGNSPED